MDPNRLCMGCMRELPENEEVCPYCGFDRKVYENTRNPMVLPSQTILQGRFLVGKTLGKGGFGITYLAWSLTLDIMVAIKEYFPTGLSNRNTLGSQSGQQSLYVHTPGGTLEEAFQKGLEDLQKEARILAKIEVPGVARVMDYFRENGTAYIVMNYIQGESLKDYMARKGGTLSEQFVLDVLKPVIFSLSRIHEKGIIHRDISPDNIMLKADRSAVLIDFGSARRMLEGREKSMTILLKHGYAPPEQYSSRGRQGPWTDVYALCATMHYLMTGKAPKEAIDRLSSTDKEGSVTEALYSAGISRETASVLAKGLRLAEEERYQNMDELYYDLYERTERIPMRRQPEPPKKKAKRSSLKEVGLAGGLAFCILAGMLILLFLWKNRQDQHALLAQNRIVGVEQGETYQEDSVLSFTAVGAGMDNLAPVKGDVRYQPVKWKMGEEKEWSEAPYTVVLDSLKSGSYTLEVEFEKQRFGEEGWTTGEETYTQAIDFSVQADTGDRIKLWKCRQQINEPAAYAGGKLKLELEQEVNGEAVFSLITEGEELAFPYQLDLTGVPGADVGILHLSEEEDTEQYKELGYYQLVFAETD